MAAKLRYRPGINTSSAAGSRSGGIHETGIITSASSDPAALMRSRSCDDRERSAAYRAIDIDATTSDARFNSTPLCQILTAARWPSHSLTKVERFPETAASGPRVSRCQAELNQQVNERDAANRREPRQRRTQLDRSLRKSESTASATIATVHEPSDG